MTSQRDWQADAAAYLKTWVGPAIQGLLWLALGLALFGSLHHVAWGFSTLEGDRLDWGYAQAIAVDIGMFALAIGIQRRRQRSQDTKLLWVGVTAFAIISTYGNLLHGMVNRSDIGLHDWTWLLETNTGLTEADLVYFSWGSLILDVLRPVLFSGVLPIMVIYLSGIVGGWQEPEPEPLKSKPAAEQCPECSQLVHPDQLARHLVVLHTSDLLEALRLLERHGLEATEGEVLAWLLK